MTFSCVKKHFPRDHKFYKIFNKNNLKLSYSCMSNVKSLINAHNKKINRPDDAIPTQPGCNCNNKDTCPLNQNCQASSLVYEATISSNIPNYQPKKYIGLCETTFKKRHSTHKTSFTHERYKNSTTLSAEYWRIKERNGTPTVTWRVVRHAKSYTPETKNCQLCLCEKFEIANYPGKDLLNKRTEIVAKCRHRSKHL